MLVLRCLARHDSYGTHTAILYIFLAHSCGAREIFNQCTMTDYEVKNALGRSFISLYHVVMCSRSSLVDLCVRFRVLVLYDR